MHSALIIVAVPSFEIKDFVGAMYIPFLSLALILQISQHLMRLIGKCSRLEILKAVAKAVLHSFESFSPPF